MARIIEIEEYRITKKGSECFRSRSWEEIKAKLEELKAKKPNARFTTQSRSARVNRAGTPDLDYLGRINWTPWMDF